MPPQVDANTDSSQANILRAHRELSTERLAQLLLPFIQELGDSIQSPSSTSNSDSKAPAVDYEIAVALQQNVDAVVTEITSAIDGLYQDLVPERDESSSEDGEGMGVEELNLVDIGEFEAALAINRMVTRMEERFGPALEALTIRLATLIDAPPLRLRLPVHVRQLCRVLQQALQSIQVPREASVKMVDLFVRDCAGKLDEYYRALNQGLSESGLCPEVEKEIAAKGSLLQQKQDRARAARASAEETALPDEPPLDDTHFVAESSHSDMPGPQTAYAGGLAETVPRVKNEAHTQDEAPSEEHLFQSVIDALHQKHSAQKSNAAGLASQENAAPAPAALADNAEMGKLAGTSDIATGLSSIQQDAGARAALKESGSLRAFLSEEGKNISALSDTEGLAPDTLDQLDLIDNIFGTISSDPDVNNNLKPALQDLQIPLAKLALLEHAFFTDPEHIGRQFIDRLSQLSSPANFPNKRLEQGINSIVEQVVNEYETDSTVFTAAVDQISKLSQRQEAALRRNVERVVNTQQGLEKLRLAREHIDRLLAGELGGTDAPRVLLDLLQSGWRDILTMAHVQEGQDSQRVGEHLSILKQLHLQLLKQQRAGGQEQKNAELDARLESRLAYLDNEISTALPTQIEHQQVLSRLREILKGNSALEMCDPENMLRKPPISPEHLKTRLQSLPRLKRWANRAQELEIDSQLSYRDSQGDNRYMRLVWTNDSGDRHLFVNDRGQKAAELSTLQLARHLSRGAKPPAAADNMNLVDKSLFDTLEETQRTLSFSRNHDSLTSLINRDTFTQQVDRALRQAHQKQNRHVLLYLDVDKFKLVNEIYDREIGDQVLLEFGKLLSQLHSSKTSSSRLEGDSFAVLLLDRDLEQGLQIAEKIRADIEATTVDIEDDSISFTVSIGAAAILEYSTGADHVLDTAQQAMRQAKGSGGNMVKPYEEDSSGEPLYLEEKSRTRQDLEKAITGKRFALRAQPIIRSSTLDDSKEELVFEMLLGLKNDDGTVSGPGEFIDSAEQYGFMNVVDRWVIQEAFAWINELIDKQKVVPRLCINLSAASLIEDRFLDYILEQISEFGVGTDRICFEITETGTISNLTKAADFVRTLRKIGCKFAIDDFGTGLANHDYLRDLPVDFVKIDGGFVRQIHHNREDFAMVKSINNLAHFLGRETIAEWVENEEVLECLRSISVDYLQGWQVGEPRLLADVTDELANIEK